MKGVPGLLLAIGLGIGGAFASWFYLAQKSQELDLIHFVAISNDKDINPDHKFTRSDLMKVSIPRNNAGSLERVAVKWDVVDTVVDSHARKPYAHGEIILHQDLATAPDTDILSRLGDKEDLLWVPIDTRTTVPSLLNAGNMVSLIVPKINRGAGPTPAERPGPPPGTSQLTELIGPFRIVALGNRMGSAAAMRALNAMPMQENVMAIAVKRNNNQFDENAQKLVDGLRVSNFQQVQILLHKNADPKKK